jgi:SpoVK/Ycf46/Vps4 family AAA+-type ATPase
MTELELRESTHPHPAAAARFEQLLGIDEHKSALRDQLVLLLDPRRLDSWRQRYHPNGLPLLDRLQVRAPLILLSGEVGCGKTALASSVASPVGVQLDCGVRCFTSPSNIRGSGLVGEISNRITEAFAQARRKLGDKQPGILIIDEADDLATSRAQMQAHHEDRAGLNVLLKEIDRLAHESVRLAVILITNRVHALDPAVRRRVSLHLEFSRPDDRARREVFAAILEGTAVHPRDLDALVADSRREPPFSYSDLVERVAHHALIEAVRTDRPVTVDGIRAALERVAPSPLIESPDQQ